MAGTAFLAYRMAGREGICPWTHKGLTPPCPWERPLLSNTGIDDKLSHWSISLAEANKNFLKYLPLNNAFFRNGFLGTCSSSSAFAAEREMLDAGTNLVVPKLDSLDQAPTLSAMVDAVSVVSSENGEVNVPKQKVGDASNLCVNPRTAVDFQNKKVEAALQEEPKPLNKRQETKEEKKLRKEREKREKELRKAAEKEEKKLRKAEEKARKKAQK